MFIPHPLAPLSITVIDKEPKVNGD